MDDVETHTSPTETSIQNVRDRLAALRALVAGWGEDFDPELQEALIEAAGFQPEELLEHWP